MSKPNIIRLVMCLFETYEANTPGTREKNKFLSAIITHFLPQALDKKKFLITLQTFNSVLGREKTSEQWLAEEFTKLEIFQASDAFQHRDIPNHHSMSFIHQFYFDSQDKQICNFNNKMDVRAKIFLEKYCKATFTPNLSPGDLVVYQKNNKSMHIAIFIGIIDGKSYAISKFGSMFRTYYHEIDNVPEHYGTATYYNMNFNITTNVMQKLVSATLEIKALILALTAPQALPESAAAATAAAKATTEAPVPIASGKITHFPTLFSEFTNAYQELLGYLEKYAQEKPHCRSVLKAIQDHDYQAALRYACISSQDELVAAILEFTSQYVKTFNINAASPTTHLNALQLAMQHVNDRSTLQIIIGLFKEYGADFSMIEERKLKSAMQNKGV